MRLLLILFICCDAVAASPFSFWKSSGTPPPTPDVAWYKFTEGSGTTTADATGNGNTGTLTAGVSWTTGPTGHGAVNFNGSTGKISIGTSTAVSSKPISYTCWVNLTSIANRTLIGSDGTTGHLQWRVGSGATLDLLQQAQALVGSSGSVITASAWIFLVMTYDGSGNYAFYQNGTSIGSGANNVTFNNSTATIGGSNGSEWMSGPMADFRIFGRALTSAEVTLLFNGGAQ